MNVKSVTEALRNGSVKDEALANAVVTGAVMEVAIQRYTIYYSSYGKSIFSDKASRTFSVVLSANIQDQLGNKIEATTQKVTLTKDTVKPATTGYKVIKDNDGKVTAIEVNFGEGLAAGTPAVPSIVSENGVAVQNFLGGLTAKAVQAGDTKVVYTAKIQLKYLVNLHSHLRKNQ